MDIVVFAAGSDVWTIEDRLGRQLGTIKRMGNGDGKFLIDPLAGKLPGISVGPFASLRLALDEIQIRTRGTCELAVRH